MSSTIVPDSAVRTPAPPVVQEVSDGIFAYVQPDGERSLDHEGMVPLPGKRRRRLTAEDAGLVMRHTVPLPGRWLTRRGEEHKPPASWSERPVLARLVLLPMRRTRDGRWTCRVGDQLLEISDVGIQKSE